METNKIVQFERAVSIVAKVSQVAGLLTDTSCNVSESRARVISGNNADIETCLVMRQQ